MKAYFVDTFHYLALLNSNDAYHESASLAVQILEDGRFWTTDAVLLEMADALSSPLQRETAVAAIRAIQADEHTTIIHLSGGIFERALTFYEQRPDKEWSLTDCLSFVVMNEHDITEALTGDHHFEQAGYIRLY